MQPGGERRGWGLGCALTRRKGARILSLPMNTKPPTGVGGYAWSLCCFESPHIPLFAMAKSLLTMSQASRASPGTLATAK